MTTFMLEVSIQECANWILGIIQLYKIIKYKPIGNLLVERHGVRDGLSCKVRSHGSKLLITGKNWILKTMLTWHVIKIFFNRTYVLETRNYG